MSDLIKEIAEALDEGEATEREERDRMIILPVRGEDDGED